jgi:hypothetical protein
MKYKIAPNFFSLIIAIIVGGALYKLFDFQNMKIDKPALALVYGITLIFCIVTMIKKPIKK